MKPRPHHASQPDTDEDERPLRRRRAEPRAGKGRTGARIVAVLGGWLLALLLAGLLAVWLVFSHYSQGLPGFGKLATYEPPIVTRIYAADGKLMAEYATQKRIFVSLSAIPKGVQQAFLSAEDKNFYSHPGVDFTGVARAIMTNIVNTGRSPVGGSTITQQVVKNFLLTNEKTLARKIKEAILSFRITRSFSKSRILELYLNEIYLGSGSYGVAAAALNYFNKSVDELTIEEAAMLAAMPKAPSSYDPRRNEKAALIRRNWVIGRMAEDGYITEEEAEKAVATPITLRQRAAEEVARADYFSEEVRRELGTRYGTNVLYEGGLYVKTTLNPTYQAYADAALQSAIVKYDRRHGWRGPLRRLGSTDDWLNALQTMPRHGIHLVGAQTLAVVLKLSKTDAEIGVHDGSKARIPLAEMKWARRQLGPLSLGPAITHPSQVLSPGDVVIVAPAEIAKDDTKATKPAKQPTTTTKDYSLQQEPQVNGAMVVMNAHTGQVLALSGGYASGDSQFNRATQARRQPGSVFKPIAYLAALEAGVRPNSIVYDAPIELPQGPGLPNWRPANYTDDFLGPVTMRTGLEQSRNAMTVRLVQQIGIGRPLELAERLGIYSKAPRMYSVILGSQETTLMALTSAYATFANGGLQVKPSLIERIDDRHGRLVWKRDARTCEDCTLPANFRGKPPAVPNVADTRKRLVDADIDYQLVHIMEGVVERGTATKAKVLGRPIAGKTGTTNDSRDVWFIGYTPDLVVGTYIGFDQPRSLGKKETGGSTALPAFISFMEKAMKDVPPEPFPVPENIRFVAVSKQSGYPVPGYAILDAHGNKLVDDTTPTDPSLVPVADSGAMEETGVDESPANETADTAPVAETAPIAAPSAAMGAGLKGAPPSPAPGIIMEAFRAEAMPTSAAAPAPTLPWLTNNPAATPGQPAMQTAPDGNQYPTGILGNTPPSQPAALAPLAPAVPASDAYRPPARNWGSAPVYQPAPTPDAAAPSAPRQGTGGLY